MQKLRWNWAKTTKSDLKVIIVGRLCSQAFNFNNILIILLSLFRPCQCGHCNVPSSPLNSPISMLPSFKPATSHTKGCNRSYATPPQNTPGQVQWTNPVNLPSFNPHLLIGNDLHNIPSSQLLPPPFMMNGLGSPCHCPACSSTSGYREGAKNTEQVLCA